MQSDLNLLYIGSTVAGDPILSGYLRREMERRGRRILSERRLTALDPEIPLELQREIRGRGAHLIVAGEEEFALVGRVLATLGHQTLRLAPEGILAPSGAGRVWEGGYTLQIDGIEISVVLVEREKAFPPLPFDPIVHRTWHWFPRHGEEEREIFRRLARLDADEVERTPVAPGWHRIEAYGVRAVREIETLLLPLHPRLLPRRNVIQALIEYLGHGGRTLTFAESCTGGRLAAAVTSESGSSAILQGSYVTYANRIKAGWLGVRERTLERYGAVSAECVREMAAGARRNLGADLAVAVSGIAGPTGAVPGKPVGTVFFCIENARGSNVERMRFGGDRNAVQEQAVLHALKMIVLGEEKIFEFFSKIS